MISEVSEPQGYYGHADPVTEAAFASCLRWACENETLRQAFEEETGMRFASSPIEAMIDDATGHGDEVAEAFVGWITRNVWGEAE